MKHFIILLAALLVIPLSVMADDDCEQAKELYQQGVNLLNYRERLAAFEKAVKICPAYAEAYVNLADAYENLGDFDQAEKYYRQAISIKPDLYVPFLGLGDLYLKTGRYRDSYDAFLSGLEIKPDHERLKAGLKVASQRIKQGREFLTSDKIKSCLEGDAAFQLMCMCPGDHYSFLKKLICIPPLEFFSGSTRLTPTSRRQLVEIGQALKSEALSKKQWLIVGHADSDGNPQHNLELSRQRSEIVRDILVNKYKLDKTLLTTKFFGQNRPSNTNDSFEGKKDNRRVEIILDD